MDKTTTQITMLGTGNATVSQIYNTCFVLQTPSTLMLVDAGEGNGILAQLKKVNVQISDIHHLFVTHAHTDHVLGVIWVIRMVAQCKGYEGLLHVYGNDKVIKVIKTIIDMILAKKQLAKVAERVVFHQLEDGDCFEVGDMKLECFDIQSTKEKQFGFRAELPSSDESDKPLVGRGLRIIESSICVAVTTGLHLRLHLWMIFFWICGTWSAGISTPRSPRATMMPSAASRISSIFSTPSAFSILAIIPISLP